MTSHGYPPGLVLATICGRLPDLWCSRHPVLNVYHAYAFGYANRLWSRRAAMALLFAANMERDNALGSGNRALRRAGAVVEVPAYWDGRQTLVMGRERA